ncbi:MAG: VTC domain-containing protein [Lachnospiraceae bacterium]
MANQTIFKRYEYKYLLTADQKKDLQAYMETYMKPDTFGRNTICNLYFDTPDYLLIRRSIEGKVYKEKIRLRTYGRAQHDSEAFIELKKKLKDGTFTIDFCDDSLHTNGNLSICGGTYTLSTGDDGMHADGADQVYGGEITIKTCYEGIEGQNMEISGGTIDITARAITEMVLWITMERRRSPGERW